MSLLMVTSFLAVVEGSHISSVKPNSATKTYYCVYTTVLHSTSGVSLPAELHIYSPFNDMVLPDETIGYVVVKAYIPSTAPEEKILLEASHFFPVPGDPSLEAYEQSIPDCLSPFIVSLGTVPMWTETLSDGITRVFSVAVSDYVRDGMRSSVMQCVFDGAHACWNRTPSPSLNSHVHFFGMLAGVAAGGGISVSLDNIVLNIGVTDPTVSLPSRVTVKKQKLSAFVGR
ncbi:hypothetical protein EDC04DRAFT_3130985 [Pisolithus marmoratus]|nr:hypothetical protein EDC04DRAFT_3130985 [Pisolithus marmoratus]